MNHLSTSIRGIHGTGHCRYGTLGLSIDGGLNVSELSCRREISNCFLTHICSVCTAWAAEVAIERAFVLNWPLLAALDNTPKAPS